MGDDENIADKIQDAIEKVTGEDQNTEAEIQEPDEPAPDTAEDPANQAFGGTSAG